MSSRDSRAEARLVRNSLENIRRFVSRRGPYKVYSCANDTYRIERVAVHCEKRKKRRTGCDECDMRGQGVVSRLLLAESIENVLNARRRG